MLIPIQSKQYFMFSKIKVNRITFYVTKDYIDMVAHSCHGKTRNLTAKTKTSRQNQILHGKSKIALVLPWVFAFAVRYLVFAVKYLVLP